MKGALLHIRSPSRVFVPWPRCPVAPGVSRLRFSSVPSVWSFHTSTFPEKGVFCDLFPISSSFLFFFYSLGFTYFCLFVLFPNHIFHKGQNNRTVGRVQPDSHTVSVGWTRGSFADEQMLCLRGCHRWHLAASKDRDKPEHGNSNNRSRPCLFSVGMAAASSLEKDYVENINING